MIKIRVKIRVKITVRIMVRFRVTVSVRVVRMYDEYHHTTTHARMMYIIKEKERM